MNLQKIEKVYDFKKGEYVISFKKENTGNLRVEIIRKDKKRIFTLSRSGKVYLYNLQTGEWLLLDTEKIVHGQIPDNRLRKGVFDLIKTILNYPIANEYLTLNYDEILLLEEVAYNLFFVDKIVGLPNTRFFEMKNNRLYYFKDKLEFINMPSGEGLTKEQFMKEYPSGLKLIKIVDEDDLDFLTGKLGGVKLEEDDLEDVISKFGKSKLF